MRISHNRMTLRRIQMISPSSSFVPCRSKSKSNTTIFPNRCLLTPVANFVSRSHFATSSCRHTSADLCGSFLSKAGVASLFACKAPIRFLSTQFVSPKSNGEENKSQLCEKIGFIGAGKIAQVRKQIAPSICSTLIHRRSIQAIMGSLVRNGIQQADKISVYDISIENSQFCNKTFGVSM